MNASPVAWLHNSGRQRKGGELWNAYETWTEWVRREEGSAASFGFLKNDFLCADFLKIRDTFLSLATVDILHYHDH